MAFDSRVVVYHVVLQPEECTSVEASTRNSEGNICGSLLLESQVFPDGFDELDLQPAGALGVLLVTGPHPMFELRHLRQPEQHMKPKSTPDKHGCYRP